MTAVPEKLTLAVVEAWWKELAFYMEVLFQQALGADHVQDVIGKVNFPLHFTITFGTSAESAMTKNNLTPAVLFPVAQALLREIEELDKEGKIRSMIDRLAKQKLVPFYTVVLVCRPDSSRPKPRLDRHITDDKKFLRAMRIAPDSPTS